MQENPYQPPAVQEVETVAPTGAESIRQQHVSHEASVKSFGSLCYIMGILNAYGVVMSLFVVWYSGGGGPAGRVDAVQLAIAVVLTLLEFVSGYGLRRLAPWSRIPAGLLCVVSLFRLPFGTLFGAYGLYLVFCSKGRMILSPQYREIVDQTPQVRYRSSPVVKIALIIFLLIIAGVVWSVFGWEA